jgi:hypothetical protein
MIMGEAITVATGGEVLITIHPGTMAMAMAMAMATTGVTVITIIGALPIIMVPIIPVGTHLIITVIHTAITEITTTMAITMAEDMLIIQGAGVIIIEI